MSGPDEGRAAGKDWERLERLLDEAVALPPSRRDEMVAAATAEDPRLGAELASLLAHADRAALFFGDLSDVARDVGAMAWAPSADLGPDEMVGARFRIEGELGHGGMGVVYRAFDMRLRRPVALKFLPAALGADARAEALFLAEARAAAALDHPNVCTLLEIGETPDGRHFLTMPCYDGETLKARLLRGPVPVTEAVEIARQVALGLAAAHRAGLVHGDVKPGNVMLTSEGVAKLLDFGLARVPDEGGAPTGFRPGTPAYMSPEQLAGRSLDGRSDLWALGVVLYEMLSGRHPFQAQDRTEVIRAILAGTVSPVSTLQPAVPAALDDVVMRLLEREPGRRFAHATEVAAALGASLKASVASRRRTVLLAGFLLAMLSASAFLLQPRPDPPLEHLTVDPLRNLIQNPELAYLAHGLREALLEELGRYTMLTVAVGEPGSDPGEAGRWRSATGGTVRGTVTLEGTHVRLDLELVRGDGRRRTWRESYRDRLDRASAMAFAAAEDLARAAQVPDTFVPLPRVADDYEPHPEAHALYLKGLGALLVSQQALGATSPEGRVHADSAVAFLGRAVDLDPAWPAAWARLAGALHWRAGGEEAGGPRRAADYAASREAAETAIRLDPNEAQALASRGFVRLRADNDWRGAGRDIERAIALDGRQYWIYALYLGAVGRTDEGVAAARRAQEQNPLSLELRRQVGEALGCAGRHSEALAVTEELWADLAPRATPADSTLMLPLLGVRRSRAGLHDQAIGDLRSVLGRADSLAVYPNLGLALARAGHVDEARKILAWSRERGSGAVPALHVALGDTAAAMDLLESWAADLNGPVAYFRCREIYQSLRGYPPMEALADRVTRH